MDLTFDETSVIDSIPEETPGKVMNMLTALKDKIKGQTTAIDNKKQLLKSLEDDKSEIDEKITALELKIRAAKSLTGDSESDKQERANIAKVFVKNLVIVIKLLIISFFHKKLSMIEIWGGTRMNWQKSRSRLNRTKCRVNRKRRHYQL